MQQRPRQQQQFNKVYSASQRNTRDEQHCIRFTRQFFACLFVPSPPGQQAGGQRRTTGRQSYHCWPQQRRRAAHRWAANRAIHQRCRVTYDCETKLALHASQRPIAVGVVPQRRGVGGGPPTLAKRERRRHANVEVVQRSNVFGVPHVPAPSGSGGGGGGGGVCVCGGGGGGAD
jgi:hypothetical protein